MFVGSVLLFAAAFWLIQKQLRPDTCQSVTITAKGEIYGRYSLSENQIIKINDTNVAEIKDGQIFMKEASCPDHLCIYQGSFGEKGGLIVCLPNEVIIEGEDVTEPTHSGMDAVVK